MNVAKLPENVFFIIGPYGNFFQIYLEAADSWAITNIGPSKLLSIEK